MGTLINFENQIQILNENRGEMNLPDYHNYSKENDPTYLTWLFGSESGIEDYGSGMTQDQKEELERFENYISQDEVFQYRKFKDSHYILSNKDFDEFEAFEQIQKLTDLEDDVEFIEFDNSVASLYGFKFCAIYHEK